MNNNDNTNTPCDQQVVNDFEVNPNEQIPNDIYVSERESLIAQDKNDNENFKNEIFKLNPINFNGKTKFICMQSKNGPCPLIAIFNVLLLRDKIEVISDIDYLTGNEMVNYVGDYITTRTDKTSDNIDSIFHNFNQLQTGLIVDVCFSNVTAFNNNSNLDIFKFLDIKLFHGWIMDPENTPYYETLINYSYDQLTEELVKDTNDIFSIETKAFLKDFINSSQLTIHGLCQLNETMIEHELAVLFYNNHFSVIYKNKEVYLLSTDIGYSSEPGTVWQLLNSTSGDTDFVNEKFEPHSSYNNACTEEYDLEYAKTIAIEDDFEIAKKLQEEEDERGAAEARSSPIAQRPPTTGPRKSPPVITPPPERSSTSNCAML